MRGRGLGPLLPQQEGLPESPSWKVAKVGFHLPPLGGAWGSEAPRGPSMRVGVPSPECHQDCWENTCGWADGEGVLHWAGWALVTWMVTPVPRYAPGHRDETDSQSVRRQDRTWSLRQGEHVCGQRVPAESQGGDTGTGVWGMSPIASVSLERVHRQAAVELDLGEGPERRQWEQMGASGGSQVRQVSLFSKDRPARHSHPRASLPETCL